MEELSVAFECFGCLSRFGVGVALALPSDGEIAAGEDVGGVESDELAEGFDGVFGGPLFEEGVGEVAAGLKILGIGDGEFAAELECPLVERGGCRVASLRFQFGEIFQGK